MRMPHALRLPQRIPTLTTIATTRTDIELRVPVVSAGKVMASFGLPAVVPLLVEAPRVLGQAV
jgi:hypothetical protein